MTLVDQLNQRVQGRVMQLRRDITDEMDKHKSHDRVDKVCTYALPKINNLIQFINSIGLKPDDCRALCEFFSDFCRPHIWGTGSWGNKKLACLFIMKRCVDNDMHETMLAIYEQAATEKIQNELLDIMPGHVATALRLMR